MSDQTMIWFTPMHCGKTHPSHSWVNSGKFLMSSSKGQHSQKTYLSKSSNKIPYSPGKFAVPFLEYELVVPTKLSNFAGMPLPTESGPILTTNASCIWWGLWPGQRDCTWWLSAHVSCRNYKSRLNQIYVGCYPDKHSNHVGQGHPGNGRHHMYPGQPWRVNFPMRQHNVTHSHSPPNSSGILLACNLGFEAT